MKADRSEKIETEQTKQHRIAVFLDSMEQDLPQYLEEIEQEAIRLRVPILRRESRGLLRFLLINNRPKRILEVGTAIGFSSLYMSEYLSQDAHIDTIEKYEKWSAIANRNIVATQKNHQITLLEGDAAQILPELLPPYDFIFMDAAKAQYLPFLPHALRLLRVGGVLVSDNCLQDGDILESRFAITHRDRTIHARMRQYLYEITHHQLLTTVILPNGDGVAVSVKTRE
ncbi:MAG: O-methyltransferase [Lachnospiraceae bacterium]|jgi:predicted O-methyltransferase YrrM|nr:O-methyltransferase [Lachnospiraceae bacterium]